MFTLFFYGWKNVIGVVRVELVLGGRVFDASIFAADDDDTAAGCFLSTELLA